jgi:polysaccharide biosynthesis transport protein
MNDQQEHSNEEAELTIRDLLNVVFRHKKKVIFFFVSVITIVSVTTLLMSKTYRSNAQILIKLGRENATLDPTVAAGTAMNINESRENEINSEMEIIKCRELAEKVIIEVGLFKILDIKENKLPSNTADSLKLFEQAVLTIQKNLTTELVKKTNVISITFDHQDPVVAQTVIKNLIIFYNEKHMLLYRPESALTFFKDQTKNLDNQLSGQMDSLRILKNSSGITSIETHRDQLTTRLNTLQLSHEQTQAELAASQAKISNLQMQLENLPKIIEAQKITGSSSSSSDALRAKLNELRMKKGESQTKYADNSRIITDLQEQIDETAVLLDKEDYNNNRSNATREIQMNLLAEQSNFAALSAKAQSMSQALSTTRAELITFNNSSLSIAKLQRESDINEGVLKKYTENLEQSRMDSDLKTGKLSNIAIVQQATLPVKPIKPRKIFSLILGLFFGIFGGLCIAFVSEFLDHTIKNSDDIQRHLKLNTLVTMPFVKSKKIPLAKAIHQDCQEKFDSLIGLIHQNNPNKKLPKKIGITSCYTGEGVSTTIVNLARAITSRYNQGKVLVVDLNISKSDYSSVLSTELNFTSEENRSITNITSAEKSAVQVLPPVEMDSSPGIHLLPVIYNEQKIPHFKRVYSILQIVWPIKNQYTHIIFDIPPLLESTIATELVQTLDGLLLIVEAERTRREAILSAVEKLNKIRMPMFGAVLNKRKFYLPNFIYNML